MAEALLLPDAAAVCDGFPIPVGYGAPEVARLALFLLSGQPGGAFSVERSTARPA